jgi:FAD/FMN-containing dehydrogenase
MPPTNAARTAPSEFPAHPATPDRVSVNDHHSRLNRTQVRRVERPGSVEALRRLVQRAAGEGQALCIAGGRHAMGGQQFAADAVLVDTTGMNRVLAFDRDRGQVEVDAGICWPDLIAWLEGVQQDRWPQWGIRQKQTGADRLSIGGSLSANAHGRGLTCKPFIDDVESFTLLGADGQLRTCSRDQNRALFALAIGGYGLFGIIITVRLRLARRTKMQRLVSVIDLADLVPAVASRVAAGCLYGDFQFAIDPMSDDFLRKGVFSCYQPIDDDAVMPEQQKELHGEDWVQLLYLAHREKSRAFELYSRHYLATHGQRYWSDSHQLSEYLDDYHRQLDARLGPSGCGTEMISELYVPRDRLTAFMDDVRADLRSSGADVIYGTIRFIEQDDESFLAWAKAPYACIIFNLHTAHTHAALEKTATDFRMLIDRAIQHGGSYFLTYHRWATRRQVEVCYPEFSRFLELKLRHDPGELFQSEWYRHCKSMFVETGAPRAGSSMTGRTKS